MLETKTFVILELLLLWVQRLVHLYNDHITFLTLKNKYSWDTCCLVFYSNEKFKTFKKVLHSAAFHWSWLSYYLEEICIYQLIFSRFVFTIVQYVLSAYKAFVFGKEERSLQNYCKMINHNNSSLLPMEIIQIRLVLFRNWNHTK